MQARDRLGVVNDGAGLAGREGLRTLMDELVGDLVEILPRVLRVSAAAQQGDVQSVDVGIEADLHEPVVPLDLRRQFEAAFDLGEVLFELEQHGGRVQLLRADEKAERAAAFAAAKPDRHRDGEHERDADGAEPDEEVPADEPGRGAPREAEKRDTAERENDLAPVHAVEFALLRDPFHALAGDDLENEDRVEPHHHRGEQGEDDGVQHAADKGQETLPA